MMKNNDWICSNCKAKFGSREEWIQHMADLVCQKGEVIGTGKGPQGHVSVTLPKESPFPPATVKPTPLPPVLENTTGTTGDMVICSRCKGQIHRKGYGVHFKSCLGKVPYTTLNGRPLCPICEAIDGNSMAYDSVEGLIKHIKRGHPYHKWDSEGNLAIDGRLNTYTYGTKLATKLNPLIQNRPTIVEPPPVHPNCRSTVLPLIGEEIEVEDDASKKIRLLAELGYDFEFEGDKMRAIKKER